MATITKLPSGSYRIRKTYEGTAYSLVVDYPVKKKEADRLLNDLISREATSRNGRKTFQKAAEEYNAANDRLLSPSTLYEYQRIPGRLPEAFRKKYIDKITQTDVSSCMSGFTGVSPKYLKNIHAYISTVLGFFRPDFKLSTKLPPAVEKDFYAPEDADVKQILSRLKGSKYEIPFVLAALGLRRSEICAIDVKTDLSEDDILTIDKGKVRNQHPEDGHTWVIKKWTKTGYARKIQIPHYLAELIRSSGHAYSGSPGSLNKCLRRVQEELGIETFNLHMFRHYFVSQGASMHIPDRYLQQAGGWKTDRVMKRRYLQAQKSQAQLEGEKFVKHIGRMLE